jgi:predicted lipoprotein with Yx(FWY)xxD motif
MKRKPSVALLAALLVSGLVVSAAALGGRTDTVSRAVVKVAYNKTLKKSIVVDGSGRTLYMFIFDIHGAATICTPQGPYGSTCPRLWPPLKSQGVTLAGKGINASLLGSTKRTDGIRQVTYNRHPLYYWHGDGDNPGDRKPGDVKGQGFLGDWYVLSPKGVPIRK